MVTPVARAGEVFGCVCGFAEAGGDLGEGEVVDGVICCAGDGAGECGGYVGVG